MSIPTSYQTFAAYNPALAARGLQAETTNPEGSIGGVAVSDGVIHFVGVQLLAGMRITGACIHISTAGAGITLSKVGLYDAAGNRLGVSADQGTAWQTIGSYTIPFIAPVNVAMSGLYYGAFITKASPTTPAPFRTGQTMGAMGAVNSGALPFGIQAGQTDLINPATISAGTGAPPIPWMGFY